jgi:hypothetical protein
VVSANPRVSLEMLPKTIAAMQDAARLRGEEEGVTVNRAVQFWALVQLAQAHGGAVYIRETPDGDLHEVTFAD